MSRPERPRFTPASFVAIASLLMAVWMVLSNPASALGATATCPADPLLSEEIRTSDVTFVGKVMGSQPDAVNGGFTVTTRVEEVWKGAHLDLHTVLRDHRLRAQPLVAGARYLFIVSIATDARQLVLQQCDEALPLTIDLAGLRPVDARVLGSATDARGATADNPVIPILAVVAVSLLGFAIVSWLRTGRRRASPSVWMAGGGSLILAGAAVAIALPAPMPAALPASSSASVDASSVAGTRGSVGPEDPTLVIRVDELTWMGDNPAVSLHSDGRYITLDAASGPPLLEQRWLTAEALDLVRAEIAATQLFMSDAPPTATFSPVLRPGAEAPGRDGFNRRITVAVNGSLRVIQYSPIFDGEREFFQPAPEIDRLERLARRLIAPAEWLPASAWALVDPEPYVADRYRITARAIPGAGLEEVTLANLAWPIDADPSELPAQHDADGRSMGCATIGRAAATELLASIGRLRNDPTLSLSVAFTIIHVAEEDGSMQELTIRSLLPDQAGCDTPLQEPPAGTLAAGTVALVRVEDLRAREGPGRSFAAADSFSAGERVVVTNGPARADGLDWYEVRQGPGDRVRWVSSGPPDGDPWIVPISNGVITFFRGESVSRMDAQGGNVTEVADATMSTWSSDGRHLALSAPPLDGQSHWQVAVANADGSALRRIAEGEDPQWSPDGTRIAFVRLEETDTLFVIDADGTDLVELTHGSAPAWSPDGGRIAFMRVDPDFKPPFGDGMVAWPFALWVRDLASGDERALTPYDVFATWPGPSWSPDGSLIAYGVDRYISADGGTPFVLAGGAMWAGDNPWSPDGEEVLVMGNDTLMIHAVDTEERRTLVDVGAPVSLQPVWSPDGTSVVYSLGLDAPPTIFVVSASGGDPVRIGPHNIQLPAWQPVVSVALSD